MASVALGIIGTVFFGPIGGAIGSLAGSFIDQALFGEDSKIKGTQIDRVRVTSSTYGGARFRHWGTVRTEGNVLWAKTRIETRTREVGGGGKGAPSTEVEEDVAFADFAVGFGEPMAALLQLYLDKTLFMDVSESGPVFGGSGTFTVVPDLPKSIDGFGEFVEALVILVGAASGPKVRFYDGSDTQQPEPLIQADKGVANTPALRGECYVVIQDLELTKFGNRIPSVEAVLTDNPTPSFPSDVLPRGIEATPLAHMVDFDQDGSVIATTGQDRGEIWVIDNVSRSIVTEWTPPLTIPDKPDGTNIIGKVQVRKGLTIDPEGYCWYSILTGHPTNHVSAINIYTGQVRSLPAKSAGLFWNGYVNGRVHGFLVNDDGWACAISDNNGLLKWRASAPESFNIDERSTAEIESDLGGSLGEFGNNVDAWLDSRYLVEMNISDAFLLPEAGSPQPTGDTIDEYGYCLDDNGGVWVMASNASNTVLAHTTMDLNQAWDDVIVITAWPDGDNLAFYPEENALLFLSKPHDTMVKVSIDTKQVTGTLGPLLGFYNGNIQSQGQWAHGPQGHIFYTQRGSNGATKMIVNLRNMTVEELNNGPVSTGGLWDHEAKDPCTYDAFNHAYVGNAGWIFLDRNAGGTTTLEQIVSDHADALGYAAADYDASELTPVVQGFTVKNERDARADIEQLRGIYGFDAVESEWQIKFRLYTGVADGSIGADDLGASEAQEGEPVDLEQSIARDIVLPERIDLTYQDRDKSFQVNNQHAKRRRDAVATRERLHANTLVVFQDDEAKQRVEKMLYRAWTERVQYAWSTTWEHLAREPGDTVTVTDQDGTVHTIRIGSIAIGANLLMQYSGVGEAQPIYSSSAIGQAADGIVDQDLSHAGAIDFFVLDIPLLRDDDIALQAYTAAGAISSGGDFNGAMIRTGTNLSALEDFKFIAASANVVHGRTSTLLGDLPDGVPFRTDRQNSVTVWVGNSVLSAQTEAAMRQGDDNILAIGNDDRWEVIQFADVTANADGSFTLSTLLRGLRNTLDATGLHTTEDKVILLTPSTVSRRIIDASKLDTERTYRAIHAGTSIYTRTKSQTFEGQSLMPYAPWSVTGTLDGSPREWLLQWRRQDKLFNSIGWLTNATVPNSEDGDAYEVDIMNGSTVVRTITGTASAGGSVVDGANQQAFYSEADQVTDFGSVQTTLTVRVYQVSTVVGRGKTFERTLEAA